MSVAAEDAARNLEDEVEKLKQDLAAAEKRALALFIAMQHTRLENSILKRAKGDEIRRDVDSTPEATYRILSEYRKDREFALKAVHVPVVKCAACGCEIRCDSPSICIADSRSAKLRNIVTCGYECWRKKDYRTATPRSDRR
jgi:hypothetical protein